MIRRLINQRNTAAIKAGIKPVIVNPLTRESIPNSRIALITKVKSPRVRMFIGRVRISRIGLMIALAMPSNRATIKAVVKEDTIKPGTKLATIRIVRADKIQFARRPNMSQLVYHG